MRLLFIILLLIFSSSTYASQQSIIISSDLALGMAGGWLSGPNEVDDGYAVLMALQSKKLKVLGITTVFGNNYSENAYYATKKLLSFLPPQKMSFVKKGADIPLEIESSYWIDSSRHELVNKNSCSNDAVKAMAETLKQNSNVTLVGLGPLTDIACLIKQYPQYHSKINRIVALMGRYPQESMRIDNKIMSDFNFMLDPVAAEVILNQQEIPVTLMPYQVNSSVFIPRQLLPKSNTTLGRYLLTATENWINQWKSYFNQDGFHPWDTHVINYLINKNEYHCSPMGYKIVSCASHQCVDHKNIDPNSLLYKESSQLFLNSEYNNTTSLLVCESLAAGAKDRLIKNILSILGT